MSNEAESALGITSQGAAKPAEGSGEQAKSVLYRIRKGDTSQGPYTLRQVRAMWESGGLTADTEYSTTDGSGWRLLFELMEGGERTTDATQPSPSGAIAMLEVQQKLKNPTTAVMLGIFLPFVGAFYGTPAAAVVPFFVGIAVSYCLMGFIVMANGGLSDSQAFVLLACFQSLFVVWSVFWSLRSVREHNAAVLAEAQKK